MMPRGLDGKVYRAVHGRNDDGDPVDQSNNVIRIEDGQGYVGEIHGVSFGAPSASPALARGEYSDTTGSMCVPIHKRNVAVQFGDTVIVESVRYKIISRPDWAHRQSLSTTRPAFAWFRVDSEIDG